MQTPEARADAVIEQIWPGDPYSGPWKQAVAQAIREAVEAAAPRWIPVGERLPEHGERVLLLPWRYVYIGRYDADVQLYYPDDAQGSSDIMTGVTHWMPLPALPDPAS